MPRILLFIVLALLVSPALAQALLQPVPEPDLSALSRERADDVRQQRAEFDSVRGRLVGPPLAAAYGMIGGVYARHGLLSAAKVAFGNALSLLPDDFELNYLAGLVAMLSDDLDPAVRHFERALAIAPDYPATRIHLASVLASKGDVARAAQLYRQAIEVGHNVATAHARLGQLAIDQRRYDQAREHFAAALAADPNATLLYGKLAAAERARGREAEAATLEANAGDGPLALADPIGRALFGPSAGPLDPILQLIAGGELRQARERLRGHLESNTEDVAAMALMARVEAGLGDFGAARRWASYALRDGSQLAVSHVAAGVVEEAAGAEDKALDHYRRGVDAEADAFEARLLLADALMRRRNYQEAARHYRVLAAKDGERAEGLPRLVAAEVMAGRCESALSAANAAREAHPRDGVRAEIWIRVAVTCPAAKAETREAALALAEALYSQHPDADSSEAAAMALAASGRFDDALDLQRQALFELAKIGDQQAIERSRTLLERFGEQRAAELPWPPGHPLLAPPRLSATQQD